MATPPRASQQVTRVVVACLDGRRLKGYVYNFSALKDFFDLLPQEDPQHRGTRVEIKDLKAVFFVKDFTGKSGYHESLIPDASAHGRKIEITFPDEEKVVGTTEAYNPQKLGSFVTPADHESNNIRIFVVTRNARQIKLL